MSISLSMLLEGGFGLFGPRNKSNRPNGQLNDPDSNVPPQGWDDPQANEDKVGNLGNGGFWHPPHSGAECVIDLACLAGLAAVTYVSYRCVPPLFGGLGRSAGSFARI